MNRPNNLPLTLSITAITMFAIFFAVTHGMYTIPETMYVGTDKDYYSNGNPVTIDGRLDPANSDGTMQFWVEDSNGDILWKSEVYHQPYSNSNYQLSGVPISIFKHGVTDYGAFGISDGKTGQHSFAYYASED